LRSLAQQNIRDVTWIGRRHRRGGRRGSTPRFCRRSRGSADPPDAVTGGGDPVPPDGAARIGILPLPLLHHLCHAARLPCAWLGAASFPGLRLHAGAQLPPGDARGEALTARGSPTTARRCARGSAYRCSPFSVARRDRPHMCVFLQMARQAIAGDSLTPLPERGTEASCQHSPRPLCSSVEIKQIEVMSSSCPSLAPRRNLLHLPTLSSA
jgi:hypothetical protein